jgi:hypothetical protein
LEEGASIQLLDPAMHPQFRPVRVQSPQAQSQSAQRSALTDQLTSLTIRRDLLSQQLRNASGESAASLQEQLRNVDAHVKATTAALDRIDEATEKAATAATSGGDAGTVIGINPGDIGRIIDNSLRTIPGSSSTNVRLDRMEKMMVGLGALNGLGLLLMAAVLWRSMRWSRPSAPSVQAGQIDQLQRAVDVIALEVERISEGQRFVTKAIANDREKRPV